MTDKLIYLIISVVVLMASLFVWQYILAIYEVRFEVNPQELYADNESFIDIKAVPINSFGFQAPFRVAEISYIIEYGKDLVEIEENLAEGKLRILSKDKTGSLVITVKSKYSLMPTKIEIIINSNFT